MAWYGWLAIGALAALSIVLVVTWVLDRKIVVVPGMTEAEQKELRDLRTTFQQRVEQISNQSLLAVAAIRTKYSSEILILQRKLELTKAELDASQAARAKQIAESPDPFADLDKRAGAAGGGT